MDLIGLIDRACVQKGHGDGPAIGEMVAAVAARRACAPAPVRYSCGTKEERMLLRISLFLCAIVTALPKTPPP